MTKGIGSRLARLSLLLLLVGCFASFAATPAAAQSLDQLRASGAVAERFDGYAMVRESGASGAKGVVDDVNRKRKKIYADRAASQGTTTDQVGRVYAGQIFAKAPSGTWFLEENGSWRQK